MSPKGCSPRILNLSKSPRRKVTIDNLLGRDGLVSALDELNEERDSMDELVGLWVSGGIIYWVTSGMSVSRLNYLLDVCKQSLLEDDE